MTKTSRHLLLPSTGLALLLLAACEAPNRTPARGPAAARAFLSALVKDGRTPGVQYAHLDQSGIVFEDVAGYADIRGRIAVSPSTTFHGYSVTKTLTAAAVLKLAAEGRIQLDAPISNWVPGLPDPRVPTVRQTLGHVGGFQNPVPIAWVHPAADHERHDEAAFFARIAQEHGLLASDPGTEFSYSNVGYLALGELVTRASGQRYVDYVSSELLAPLGSGGESSLRFELGAEGRHAKGYVRHYSLPGLAVGFFIDRARFIGPREGAWDPFVPLQVDGSAYGGLLGNARGFGRYLRAILRREGPFSEEVVRGMFAPGTAGDGAPTPAAHGWFSGELDGEPYFHHAGAGGGYYSEIRVYPGLGRASVILMNRSAMKDERVLDQLDPLLLPDAKGERNRSATP